MYAPVGFPPSIRPYASTLYDAVPTRCRGCFARMFHARDVYEFLRGRCGLRAKLR